MSTLRRVEDETKRISAGMSGDEAMYVACTYYESLSEDVRVLWCEQCAEVERMIPQYGSFDAALLAWEAAHPDAP